MRKRKARNRVVAILVAFAVAFTMMPAAVGGLDANAATTYWKNIKAKAVSETSVKLSWKALTKAQQKKISGIAIYRDGKLKKRISKYAKSFNDTRLKAGSKHTYQLKTYKIRVRTVTYYFNKKTGKWQTKRISGARTKKRKKNIYKYFNASPRFVAVTNTPYDPGTGDDPGAGDQPTTDPKMVQITDYKGNTITVEEGSAQYNDPRYNRNIDGSFTVKSVTYTQKGGVTFLLNPYYHDATFVVYNGDSSKMSLEHSKMNEEEVYKAWNYNVDFTNNETAYDAFHNPTYEMVKYIRGDRGRRLADVITTQESKSNYTRIKITFSEYKIDSGSVTVTAKYDGEIIDTAVIDLGTELGSDGLDVSSRNQYEIAKNAVAFFESGNGIPTRLQQSEYQRLKTTEGEYYAHMKAIMAYVAENFLYEEMSCWGGAEILEIYSILEYEEFGHMIRPYFDAETNPNTGHMGFRPNSYCDKGWFGRYFDTAGHR